MHSAHPSRLNILLLFNCQMNLLTKRQFFSLKNNYSSPFLCKNGWKLKITITYLKLIDLVNQIVKITTIHPMLPAI